MVDYLTRSMTVSSKIIGCLAQNFSFGSFPFVPPQYVKLPPIREHVLLHSKSLCKDMASASGGANNMHPLSWGGGHKRKRDLFRLCPPSLVGAYYLQPPDARAIFLHNDLLCNDTCSVTGGSITYWGAQTEKIPEKIPNVFLN